MKRLYLVAMVVGFLGCSMQSAWAIDMDSLKAAVKDENRIVKEFPIERQIDATTASRLAAAQNIPIVDIRTVQEYQLVGHPPGAYSIPFMTWGKWDGRKNMFGFDPNPEFIKMFESVFTDKKAPYIIMCRSGHRSAKAVKVLGEVGYINLYNMWEGFEGLSVKDKNSPDYGKKMVDGWRFKGLPYTYDMEPRLVIMK